MKKEGVVLALGYVRGEEKKWLVLYLKPGEM